MYVDARLRASTCVDVLSVNTRIAINVLDSAASTRVDVDSVKVPSGVLTEAHLINR
jgi:hypothetical protein